MRTEAHKGEEGEKGSILLYFVFFLWMTPKVRHIYQMSVFDTLYASVMSSPHVYILTGCCVS